MFDLKSFVDLSEVDDIELIDLDFKRAETEGVKLEDNYPKFFKGNDIGIMVIHGFTGSPLELEPLTSHLVDSGYSVYRARVAGHGSSVENLNATNFKDWYESVRYGYFLLRRNCRKVFVLGESMGGLVALNCAWLNGADGVILLAPCIKIKSPFAGLTAVVKHFIKTIPKFECSDFLRENSHIYYDRWSIGGIHQLVDFTRFTKANMEHYEMPLLGFQFTQDPVVSAEAVKNFFDKAPSFDKKLIEYKDKEGVTHILASERNRYRDEMFSNIKDWIDNRSGNV